MLHSSIILAEIRRYVCCVKMSHVTDVLLSIERNELVFVVVNKHLSIHGINNKNTAVIYFTNNPVIYAGSLNNYY